MEKLLGTYVDKLPEILSPRDGKLHGEFLQFGADTGRFSSKNPNLQNIPAGGDNSVRRMFRASEESSENEIIALANGCKNIIDKDSTILDLGSRDAKWIKFKDSKFHDMDWNTSCASSTGATVEMLLKFYGVRAEELAFDEEKFAVTCGIFGMEKIMDSISAGVKPSEAISKFVHGIAFNAWNFCKKPEKIYLSGGFCDNKCLVDSLKNYCEVELLGRFVLCEGLF